jgi:20S proteasome alpha/beta subunit
MRWSLGLLAVLVTSSDAAAKRGGAVGGSDLTLNAYTQQGEVAQVVYATRAVAKAPTSIVGSLSAHGYSLLFSVRKKPSKLVVADTRGTVLERCGGDFTVGVTGIPADCAACRSHCNVLKNTQQFSYGKTPSMSYIAQALVMWLTRGMYRGEPGGDDDGSEETAVVRPIAASALLSGADDGCLRLVAVECSGAVRDCTFACLGDLPGGQPVLRRLEDALAALEAADVPGERGGDGAFEKACGAVTRIAELLLQEADDEAADDAGAHAAAAAGDEDTAERRGALLMECSITTLSPKAVRLIGPFSSLPRLQSLLKDMR